MNEDLPYLDFNTFCARFPVARAAFHAMSHAKLIRALLVEEIRSPLGARMLLDQHPDMIELVQADDLAAALDHLALAPFDVVLFALSSRADLGRKALRRVLVSVPASR
jgi:hypothetical protein